MSMANRSLGNFDTAERMLNQIRTSNPDDPSLNTEFSEVALAQRKWNEAIVLLQKVFENLGHKTPARIYFLMTRALRGLGHFDQMDRLLRQGLRTYPNDVVLAVEFVASAVFRKAWAEGIKRGSALLNDRRHRAGPSLYRMLARAQRGAGEFEAADATVSIGMARHPSDLKLAIEHVEVALARGNWMQALERGWATLKICGDRAPARLYVLMSIASMSHCDMCAELATARPDWADGIKRWQEALDTHGERIPPAIRLRMVEQRPPHAFANGTTPNAVFLWIPKTAGTSLYAALSAIGCPKLKTLDLARNAFSGKGIVTFGHMDYRWLLDHGHVTPEFDQSALKFTFARNPFSRAASLYFYLKNQFECFNRQPTFQDFLELLERGFFDRIGPYNVKGLSQCNPQVRWLSGIDVGFIGKIENTDNDFERLQQLLGITLPRLAVHKKGQGQDVASLFDKTTKYLVESIYDEDFTILNYPKSLP
jgi:hypothetical protein